MRHACMARAEGAPWPPSSPRSFSLRKWGSNHSWGRPLLLRNFSRKSTQQLRRTSHGLGLCGIWPGKRGSVTLNSTRGYCGRKTQRTSLEVPAREKERGSLYRKPETRLGRSHQDKTGGKKFWGIRAGRTPSLTISPRCQGWNGSPWPALPVLASLCCFNTTHKLCFSPLGP